MNRPPVPSMSVTPAGEPSLAAHDGMIPSLCRVERTLATDIAYTVSRMRVLENLPGNPIGIGYQWVDETAVALVARLPAFCRIVGLRAGHEAHIAPLVSWYRDRGAAPAFEMIPGHFEESMGRELARLGFYQSGFHVSLIARPVPLPKDPGGRDRTTQDRTTQDRLGIERVADAASMEACLDAYVAGWELDTDYGARFKANVKPWLGLPGWSLYVARPGGRPAAAAILYLRDGVGYLADAATDPAFRGRGLQSALLRRRIHDAASAGADLVFSGAPPFSTSHRNMERAGMRVQFMRSLWTQA